MLFVSEHLPARRQLAPRWLRSMHLGELSGMHSPNRPLVELTRANPLRQ